MSLRTLVVIGLTILVLIVIAACTGDAENERTVEWAGLDVYAGSEVLFTLQPLPGASAVVTRKSDPLSAQIGNGGLASYSYNYAGPTEPGLAYYYVDGNENGQCDEYNSADHRGVHEFAASDQLISIEFVESSLAPEGVCTYFGADLDEQAAAQSTSATDTATPDTMEVTNPTATPTHTPSFEELYEEAALAAAQRFFDAGNAHDIDAARRATTKDSFFVDDDYFEVQKALADVQYGESDYATFNITNLFLIDCTETRCELIVDIDKFYPSGDGGSIRIPIYVELEDGEWKYDWS